MPLDESEYVLVDKIDSKSDVSYELMHFSQEVADYEFLDLGVDVGNQADRPRPRTIEEEEESLATKIQRIFSGWFENEEEAAPQGATDITVLDGSRNELA